MHRGGFAYSEKVLVLQCDRWKQRIFYENARAVTGHARRLLLPALGRRRQERGSTPPATATLPRSALPWVGMAFPKGTGCSRWGYSSLESPPKVWRPR